MRRLLLAAALAALTLPVPAQAGTVTATDQVRFYSRAGDYRYTDVRYDAGPGEANEISILQVREGRFVLRDAAGVEAGAGCTATDDPTVVTCARQEHSGKVEVYLGDGADRMAGDVWATFIDAGPGDDRIELPSRGFDFGPQVYGGEGADVLEVPDGNVAGGPGPDDMTAKQVSYGDHAEPIVADLDGEADDGAAGEGDRIDASVRRLIGGDGADRLTGSDADNTLEGGTGDDVLGGGDGDDELSGGDGTDRLDGGRDDDLLLSAGAVDDGDGVGQLRGGPGRDRIFGTTGREAIDGGAGRDRIVGVGGDDRITAADGEPDLVTCALGRRARSGRARLDQRDLARGCARLSRPRPAAPRLLLLGLSDLDRRGVVRVGIGCSQEQRGGCRARVRLRRGGRTLADRRRRIPAGRALLLRPRVPPRLFRGRAPCGGVRVTVAIRTWDAAGRARSISRRIEVGSVRRSACNRRSLSDNRPAAGW